MEVTGEPLLARRWLVIGLSLCSTAAAAISYWPPLILGLLDALDWCTLIIFIVLMFAGSLNLWLYVLGFILWRREALERRTSGAEPTAAGEIRLRTAIVMPICNEDTERVQQGIRQTWKSALRCGLGECCDFFILSDSTDRKITAAEDQMYHELLQEFQENTLEGQRIVPGRWALEPRRVEESNGAAEARRSSGRTLGRIYLVRRTLRGKFKAGNIAHFLERHGRAYDLMMVLDADSVMAGPTIQRAILTLQASSQAAILQTLMLPIRASTPFARFMQFGISRCIPLFASGLSWFLGRDSVYWGHNALVRIEPFMAHANLPILPGKPPLGGDIMSQDIVEAALLGRAGWAVTWDPHSRGSFDEIPANIFTYGRRDRRWCQGNLQHFWLMLGEGMTAGHRLYFANGILAYLAGGLVVVLALCGYVQGLRGREYRFDPLMLTSFLAFFGMMLILPRLGGFLRFLTIRSRFQLPKMSQAEQTRAAVPNVSVRMELASILLEILFSLLLAPSLFYLHTRFVLEILCGRVAPWQGQPRSPDLGLDWSAAIRLFWLPTVLGLAWGVAVLLTTPAFFPYLVPLLVGWILSIPLAVFTSIPRWGAWLRRKGLLAELFTLDEIEMLGPLYASSNSNAKPPSAILSHARTALDASRAVDAHKT